MNSCDRYTVIHGEGEDLYYLIEEDDKLLVVHTDYDGQESAVVFEVAIHLSDWSEGMLIETAKQVVDSLNQAKFYPNGNL